MSHVNYIEYVQNKSLIFLFVKIVVRRFASHVFDTFNKKWRQVKPKKDNIMVKLDLFFWIVFLGHVSKKNQHIHFMVHGHSSWSTFGLHPVKGPWLSKLFFLKSDGSWTMNSDHWIFHLPWSNFMVHIVNRPLKFPIVLLPPLCWLIHCDFHGYAWGSHKPHLTWKLDLNGSLPTLVHAPSPPYISK